MVKFKTKISDIRRRNKVSIEESVATQMYLRDYYLKDYKYISPEMQKVKQKIGRIEQKASLLEKWLSAVMKGIEQFFYQGSLHGVKLVCFFHLISSNLRNQFCQ